MKNGWMESDDIEAARDALLMCLGSGEWPGDLDRNHAWVLLGWLENLREKRKPRPIRKG